MNNFIANSDEDLPAGAVDKHGCVRIEGNRTVQRGRAWIRGDQEAKARLHGWKRPNDRSDAVLEKLDDDGNRVVLVQR
jgi:hypothetical protein